MPHLTRSALIACALLAVGQPAGAKDTPSERALHWMTTRVVERSTYGSKPMTRDDMRRVMMQSFAEGDLDGDGKVSQADHDLGARIQTAQQRSQAISQILRDDLDGDWRVTRAEYATAHAREVRRPLSGGLGGTVEPTPDQIAELTRQMMARGMTADANADGVITQAEMAAHAETTSKQNRYYGARTVPEFLDTNGDGAVARAEFLALFEQAFATVDANRDGTISPEERAGIQVKVETWRREEQEAERERQADERARQQAEQCGFPKLPATSKVAVVSAYEGKALSTVSLGGDDEEVTVARVVVEPGRDPLALVLTSYDANIWLVEGAVERVTTVIASSQQGDAAKTPRVGVVGVPRDKVAVAKTVGCLRYASSGASDKERFTREVKSQLAREPDTVAAEYGLTTVRVPSGKLDEASALPGARSLTAKGPSAGVWKEMLRFNPAGLVDIDPARVVSAVKAARYAVLPQQAGLAQLVESGALDVTGAENVVRIGGTTFIGGGGDDQIRGAPGAPVDTYSMPSQFTIRKQITFPAGLNGAHSVTFILPAGVPEPQGNPGHSQIVRTK